MNPHESPMHATAKAMTNHRHHSLHFWHLASKRNQVVSFIAALTVLFVLTLLLFGSKSNVTQLGTNPAELLQVTIYSLSRMIFAYIISLAIAVGLALVTMTSRRAESFLIPLFDVLGSIPALAFFPVAVIAFASINLNLAAIFILLTDMIWPLVFGMISAIHLIPDEVKYAARMYGATRWKYIREIILPASFPALVTGTILAWGVGWNIIIISEWISVNGKTIVLPGLGSLLNKGAYGLGGQPPSATTFALALLMLVIVIVLINTIVWQRLLHRSEKYKFDA